MKVYVVTSGEYSDYGINAIFSTKEKAEEYKKRSEIFRWRNSLYDEFDIEEWEMDEKVIPRFVVARVSVENGELSFEEDIYQDIEYPHCNRFYRSFRVRYSENIEVMKKAAYDQNAMYLAKLEDV